MNVAVLACACLIGWPSSAAFGFWTSVGATQPYLGFGGWDCRKGWPDLFHLLRPTRSSQRPWTALHRSSRARCGLPDQVGGSPGVSWIDRVFASRGFESGQPCAEQFASEQLDLDAKDIPPRKDVFAFVHACVCVCIYVYKYMSRYT